MGFANYAYNTAEGGGLGATNSQHAVNVGAAFVNPLDVHGEVALNVSWSEPIDAGLRSQSGVEIYWKLLVMPNLWLTPGVQYVAHPTFNTGVDSLTIAQVKLSLFF